MSLRPTVLDEKLHPYFLTMLPARAALFAELEAEMEKHSRGQMSVAREEGVFLAWLASTLGAKKILEIGVFTGHSSLSMAAALPDDARIIACDVSEEFTRTARSYWKRAGVEHKVDLRIAPALETLAKLRESGADGSFDLAFIDADKASYAAYYEACLALVRKGGVIAIDNVLWSGRVADASFTDGDTIALRALNAQIAKDPRVTIAVVPLADGITLATKR